MAAHRYWRLTIYETVGGPSFPVPELWRIAFRTSVGGPDLEDVFGIGDGSSEAFDNNLDDPFYAGINGSLPEHVTADLGSIPGGEADIVEFTVQASSGNAGPKRLALAFSDDNVTYTTLTEYSDLSWVDDEVKVFLSGNPSTPIAPAAIESTIWRPVITIDGADVSNKITGTVLVGGEESTAKIASFLFKPDSGVIDAAVWLNKPVTIDYETTIGSVVEQNRLFTGIIDLPQFNRTRGLFSFDCTDDMPGQIQAMTQSELDALIVNSSWSEAVFGEYKNSWLYFENLLDTHPQSYDLNVDGVTGTLADWTAKSTPDFSYDESSIIDNTISYSIASRRELFNEFTLEYSYRYKRLKHRDHTFRWEDLTFCSYRAKSHELPTKEMISNAADGTGWHIKKPILFGVLPKSGPVCGGVNWVVSDETVDNLAITARFDASKRWDQLVTENYVLTVRAPQSITWLGTIPAEEAASNETEFDSGSWDNGSDTPTGYEDSVGDMVQDKHDRTVSSNDIQTFVSKARTEIRSSHRNNTVTAEVELNPLLERFHTVRHSAEGITGQGKVSSFVHNMDIDAGLATTEITISISLNGGASPISDTSLFTPPAPDTQPSITAPSSSTSLPSRIGNDDGVPDYDESWVGFTANFDVPYGTPTEQQSYEREFKVSSPDIEQEVIDAVEAETSETYNVNIPNETLTITVP